MVFDVIELGKSVDNIFETTNPFTPSVLGNCPDVFVAVILFKALIAFY